MDEGLFTKYRKQLTHQKETKQNLCDLIEKETGVSLEENEISITKNQIQLHTTSVVKQKLFQKNIEKLLKTKNFILKN